MRVCILLSYTIRHIQQHKQTMARQMVKIGTYGGKGIHNHDIGEADPPQQLLSISLEINDYGYITRFSFTYKNVEGNEVVVSPAWGNDRGTPQTIDLSSTGEKLVEISGSLGRYTGGQVVIGSLTFITDGGRTFGPYGKPKPENLKGSFSLPLKDGSIVGFFGTSGGALDSLGFYAAP